MLYYLIRQLWTRSPRDLVFALMRKLSSKPSSESKPRWCKVESGPLIGLELYIAPEAVDTWAAMAKGNHDSFLFDAVKTRLPVAGNCFWDVGAHIGYHSMSFAMLAGSNGKVFAFEPSPANRIRFDLQINRNTIIKPLVSISPLALSDSNEKARFVFSNHLESGMSSGSHLVNADTPLTQDEYKHFHECDVETTSIDVLIEKGFSKPGLIKIDVEGAEAAVLRGGKQFIQQFQPFLLIEVHHILQMVEITSMLQVWGYHIEVLDRKNATPGRCFIVADPINKHA